ncbi:hypothetical protein CYMTET_32809 [Cymbomonas tetramitiformis]|uniref:Reverse transcriptase/retrotransposon-derived protein RNase H-like domain-containing protein n=1 Tax=Cymbomonas tetramitiformis TaxID=36881 RepID=A0AAE0FEX2_9CHLO|nr:hypothetical protein CYMTET_32809 [Cymbomonas tetramitiformis]
MAARTKNGEPAFKVEAEDLHKEPGDSTSRAEDKSKKCESEDTRDAEATAKWKEKFKNLFDEFENELRDALPSGLENLRHADEDQAKINLKPDREGGQSPSRRPYNMSVEELRQLRERIEQLVEKGQLNSQTIRDRYPLPDIQVMLDEMQGATHFSTFDAVDGFWQVTMAPEDVEKTAFTTQMGAYEWLFLGLAGYYRRFINCFSEIAQPLTKLTKSDVPWQWGPEQQWAFRELKEALVKAPILALPNMKAAADGSAPFLVQTDASDKRGGIWIWSMWVFLVWDM